MHVNYVVLQYWAKSGEKVNYGQQRLYTGMQRGRKEENHFPYSKLS